MKVFIAAPLFLEQNEGMPLEGHAASEHSEPSRGTWGWISRELD
jgi:hypothetical protein